jgi:hypothetical protein
MKFNPKGEGEIFILGKVNILMSFNKEGGINPKSPIDIDPNQSNKNNSKEYGIVDIAILEPYILIV